MLKVRQLRTKNWYSYIVFDDVSREALVVDPVHGLSDMFEMLLDADELTLIGVVETHTQWDRASGRVGLLDSLGGRALACPVGNCQVPPFRGEGTELKLGSEFLTLRLTPGVTDDSVSLFGDGFMIAGSALKVGGFGALGLPRSSAGELFGSARGVFSSLSDDTLVFPADDCHGILFSTMGHERESNSLLSETNQEQFEQALALQPPLAVTQELHAIHTLNLSLTKAEESGSAGDAACGCLSPAEYIALGESPQCPEVQPEKAHSSLAKGIRLLDVREAFEQEIATVPGAHCLAMSELAERYQELDRAEPLHVLCAHGNRSALVTVTLRRLGYKAASVVGGVSGWRDAGLILD